MYAQDDVPSAWPTQPPLKFAGEIIANPSQEELRRLALKHTPFCRETSHGSLNKIARNKARVAQYTYVIDREGRPDDYSSATIDEARARSLIEGQKAYMAAQGTLLVIDGRVGAGPRSVACQWCYTLEGANIAGMQQVLAFPPTTGDEPFEPNFRLFYTPDYRPDMPGRQAIIVDLDNYVTYIMGADYFGESKKGALRMLAALHFRHGGLVMHAGAKTIDYADDRQTLAVLGLSGTGKTTTTFSEQGSQTQPVQDDMVTLWPDAEISVTENGCFAKTFGLDPAHEPVLHAGTCRREAWLENVYVDADGQPIFDKRELTPAEVARLSDVLIGTGASPELVENYSAGERYCGRGDKETRAVGQWSENGRSIIPMSCIENAQDPLSLPRLRSLGILNRDEGPRAAMPGLLRFRSPEQATGYFMLGETSKTSAAGSERGKTRSPFTQPFFPLAHRGQAERFVELAKSFEQTQMWLMNTGFIGGDAAQAKAGHAIDIRIRHSNALLQALLEGNIVWTVDEDFGYEVVDVDAPENAELVARVDAEILQPRRWFARHDKLDDYREWVSAMNSERQKFLERHHVAPEIISAVLAPQSFRAESSPAA